MPLTGNIETPRRLFGTSGLRGIVHKELTVQTLYELGQAVATSLPASSQVVIATDTRLSREKVKTTVVMGLLASGVNVIDLGILPTPALAFSTKEMQATTGIMVTASHNPPEYNGIKLFNSDGIGYSREQELAIEDIYAQKNFRTGESASFTHEPGAKELYFRKVIGSFPGGLSKKFKIVIDPGNGAASLFASELFSRLGLDVLPVNDTPDGSFPGRSPEPREDTLTGTYEFLKKNHADLAVCFDGDADRVVFLDKEGFIGFNEAVTFISALAVKTTGKKKVATTVEAGMLIDLALSPLGVSVVRGKVGDVPVAYLARENDAAIGIEPVGVYILPEAGFYPDSFLAALTLLKNIDDPAEIRAFFRGIPRLVNKQRQLPCPNELKNPVMSSILGNTALFGKGTINTVDGLRLDSGNSWVLVRSSGTEPLLRIIAESPSESETDRLLDKTAAVVEGLMRGLS
ncbi:MAG: phosphoglucosamine mutase [Dehalococcoidia bacterium]|nr:phosphoglucosamine mutase [Dehalococcoidia bacterium]